jgi:hypothetical protein
MTERGRDSELCERRSELCGRHSELRGRHSELCGRRSELCERRSELCGSSENSRFKNDFFLWRNGIILVSFLNYLYL